MSLAFSYANLWTSSKVRLGFIKNFSSSGKIVGSVFESRLRLDVQSFTCKLNNKRAVKDLLQPSGNQDNISRQTSCIPWAEVNRLTQ
jgi:hypothetical protein